MSSVVRVGKNVWYLYRYHRYVVVVLKLSLRFF